MQYVGPPPSAVCTAASKVSVSTACEAHVAAFGEAGRYISPTVMPHVIFEPVIGLRTSRSHF